MDGSTHSGSLEFRPVIRLRTRHGYLCSTIAIVSELFFFDRAANTMQFDGYPDPEFFKDANSNPALFCKNIFVFIPTVPYCCRLSRRFCILSDTNNILVNIQHLYRNFGTGSTYLYGENDNGIISSASVVDPNTLSLDPDPGFWPNLAPDPGPDPGLYYQLKRETNSK